jgi:S1-C subfamily serine protease
MFTRGGMQYNYRLLVLLVMVLAACASVNAQTSNDKNVPTLAREASPSVVRILLRDQNGAELGTGSGFVVSHDGNVVTNYHVVHVPGLAQAEARFVDGATYQIQGIISMDPDKDLAIVKLQAVGRDFTALELGASESEQVGEHVVAIGSPLAGVISISTEATVSDGIISGVRDWPEHQIKIFQITAPISPGSSGGVLLNSRGQAIGVTFAQLVGGQNLNFAIPATYVRAMLGDSAIKPLTSVNTASVDERPRSDKDGPGGSYTGVWKSGRFGVTGAASLKITISSDSGSTNAEIFLTGGEVKSAILTGFAHRTGENIWTVDLSSKKPKLHVRGIFRGGSFVGDYTYTRFLMLDQGQWLLKKE